MHLLGTDGFWTAVAGVATVLTIVLSSRKTRKHVDGSTYEIRELRRVMMEHLRDHSTAGKHSRLF